jgi:EF hand
MRNFLFAIIISSIVLATMAQQPQKRIVGSDSYANVPAEGVLSSGLIPDMNAFSAVGDPIKVRELCQGKYTVLAAGCLTCPLFHQNYPEIEAAYADYAPKGVQFFYFYKQLRHPELDGYMQAQNMSERLLQLAEARKKLGTKVPWIADTMDDDMRKGLRSGSWSVYLISPKGEVVYASGRIDANGLRSALSKAVGPVATPTKASDLNLPQIVRPASFVNEDSELGVARPDGLSIVTIIATETEETYYVKLRAEADDALLNTGTGRLFLGFYPDPIHHAYWNNLTEPMKYKLTLPEGVVASPAEASSQKATGDKDTKPRQFWVDISSDKPFDEIGLKLDYFGCTSEMCLPLTHEYTIKMENENRGSRTYGMNTGRAGSSIPVNSVGHRMEGLDTSKDGLVSYDEMYTQMMKRNGIDFSKEKAQQHFDRMDLNKDGFLSLDELTRESQNQRNRN